MARVEPTPQPSGRVLFSQTEQGSRTIYEAPHMQRGTDGKPVFEGRVLRELATHPGLVVYGPSSQDVVESRGDAYYDEYAGLMTAPAPTRVVNAPPPFGYNGIIYDKDRGQHRLPSEPKVQHREETEYGQRVTYTPIEGYSIPPQGVSTQDTFPSRVVSKTVYPSRFVHDGSDKHDPRALPIPGVILPGGAVYQHGYAQPVEVHAAVVNGRRNGDLEAAAAARGNASTNGQPWQRDFSMLPAPNVSTVPWKEVLYAQVPQERLIGLHVPPCVGLKVALSQHGISALQNDPLGPSQSKGRPGVITQVHPDGDAVMVLWDAVKRYEESESGWYRCGAYGQYSLCIHSTGNKDGEIEARAERVKHDGPFASDIRELGFGY